MFFAGLEIPEFTGLVHGASRQQTFVWVEADCDDLSLVPCEGMDAVASICVPDLGSLVEGTSCDSITT